MGSPVVGQMHLWPSDPGHQAVAVDAASGSKCLLCSPPSSAIPPQTPERVRGLTSVFRGSSAGDSTRKRWGRGL